jgi:hypothetical protein
MDGTDGFRGIGNQYPLFQVRNGRYQREKATVLKLEIAIKQDRIVWI